MESRQAFEAAAARPATRLPFHQSGRDDRHAIGIGHKMVGDLALRAFPGQLIYAGLHFLSQDMLLDLALLYVPALIGLWASHFPKWTDMVLLAITVVIGYWLQRLNLIAIGGIIILVTLINSRRPFKVPSYLYQFSPVIATLLLYLARMHG